MKHVFNVVRAGLVRNSKLFDLRILFYTALASIVGNLSLCQLQLADAMNTERSYFVRGSENLERRELIPVTVYQQISVLLRLWSHLLHQIYEKRRGL